MPKYILTVTLNPAIDHMVDLKTKITDCIALSAGGKGLNVSRVLKNLRVPTLATGILGGTNSEWFIDRLREEGIACDFIESQSTARHNITFLDERPNETKRVISEGPLVSRSDFARFKKKFSKLVKRASYAVFSGSLPRGISNSAYQELIKISKRAKVKTVLDGSGSALRTGLRAKPYLIKPNLEEAQKIMGRLNSKAKIKRALLKLHKKGISKVIISLDSRGAIGFDGTNLIVARTPKLSSKNIVGCGDALVAGFLVAESQGKNFKDSVRYAVAVGAANVLGSLPGEVSPRSVRHLYSKVSIREIG